MKIARFLLGAALLCSLPALAQPETKPVDGVKYPLLTPEEATKLVTGDKIIKLHLRDVTLGDALQELQKQSDVTLDTSFGARQEYLAKKLSLDLETRSFIEAFTAILDKADVKAELQHFGVENSPWKVMFGQLDDVRDQTTSGVGIFQIRLVSLTSTFSKNVKMSKTPSRSQNNYLSVTLEPVAVPQLNLSPPTLRLTRADDDKGHSLIVQNRPDFYDSSPFWMRQSNIALQIPVADDKSTHLTHLDGVAVYTLPTKSESWELADVVGAKNETHSFTSNYQTIEIKILDATQNGAFLDVSLEIKLSAIAIAQPIDNNTPFSTTEQLLSSFQLQDAKGQILRSTGYTSSANGNLTSIQANFSPAQTAPLTIRNGQPVPAPPLELAQPIKLTVNFPTPPISCKPKCRFRFRMCHYHKFREFPHARPSLCERGPRFLWPILF